jgi:hypothetical protein
MKRSLLPLLLAFTLPAVLPLGAAESKPAAKAAATATLQGKYAGEWKGQEESTGALKLSFKQDAAGAWTAEAAFTFDGAEIPAKTKSVKIEGAKVELVFEWNVQGTSGRSSLKGELKGDTIEGKYDSNVAEAASSGSWKVKRTS